MDRRLAAPRKLTQEINNCEAIAKVLIETGMDAILAQQRAEDAAISIQGSLILAQGLDDPSPFQRVIQQLPQAICRDAL